jgi:hypothetical protein
MRFLSTAVALLAATFINGVRGAAATDEYRDADPQQSSYLPNHNMDPAIINSPQFGQLWKTSFKGEFVRRHLCYHFYVLFQGQASDHSCTQQHRNRRIIDPHNRVIMLTAIVLRESPHIHTLSWRSANALPRLEPKLYPDIECCHWYSHEPETSCDAFLTV